MKRFLFGLLAASALTNPAFAAGSDQLRIFLNASLSARGSFSQTVIAQNGRKPQQSAGQFALQRPGKFRWSYETPYATLLVSDGQTLSSYDPELKQVVVKKLGQMLTGSPAELLAGGDLEKNFALSDAGSKDGLEFVEAKPRKREGSFSTIRIGLANNQPVIMEVQDNFGQTTVLRFTRFESNPNLPADQFKFKPPAGADVISE